MHCGERHDTGTGERREVWRRWEQGLGEQGLAATEGLFIHPKSTGRVLLQSHPV